MGVDQRSLPASVNLDSAKCFGHCFFANAGVRGILILSEFPTYIFYDHPGMVDVYTYSGEFSCPLYPEVPLDCLL